MLIVMNKIFLPFEKIRNDGIKLANKIYKEGFIPDVIFVSLRGGSALGNVMSDYFNLALGKKKRIKYAAIVPQSYSGMEIVSDVILDGFTIPPESLKPGSKILLVDDIFDTGGTINFLLKFFLEKGIKRSDIKVAVHDYKYFPQKTEQLPFQPDYWCNKIVVSSPEDNVWIHYLSHELLGLTKDELEKYYYSNDRELEEILGPYFS